MRAACAEERERVRVRDAPRFDATESLSGDFFLVRNGARKKVDMSVVRLRARDTPVNEIEMW